MQFDILELGELATLLIELKNYLKDSGRQRNMTANIFFNKVSLCSVRIKKKKNTFWPN